LAANIDNLVVAYFWPPNSVPTLLAPGVEISEQSSQVTRSGPTRGTCCYRMLRRDDISDYRPCGQFKCRGVILRQKAITSGVILHSAGCC